MCNGNTAHGAMLSVAQTGWPKPGAMIGSALKLAGIFNPAAARHEVTLLTTFQNHGGSVFVE